MPNNTLLITPADCSRLPEDPDGLLAKLRQQGLIGEAIDPAHYHIGDAYPRLLSFMGCSPYFKTEPESADDTDYCHLEVLGPWPQPRLLGRLADAWPRCPACRKRDRGWRQGNGDTDIPLPPADALWTCPHCSHQAAWGSLDWRRRAGYARFALVLHHIFEGEAVPGPELLATLGHHADSPWTWFYA